MTEDGPRFGVTGEVFCEDCKFHGKVKLCTAWMEAHDWKCPTETHWTEVVTLAEEGK